MKFIVDESTGKRAAVFLDKQGYDTVFVGDEFEGISDTEIMNKARTENRIIVTNDKDFGELAVKEKKSSEGIILLRLKIETPNQKIKVLGKILDNHKQRIQGNLLIAKEEKIKIREIK